VKGKINVKLMFIPPYSTQSNGLAERSVQTFKILLSKFLVSHRSSNLTPEQMLLECLFAYRTTPSSVTGKSPMAMLLSFDPITPLSTLKKRVRFDINTKVEKHVLNKKRKNNVRKNYPSYDINNLVWVNLNKKVFDKTKYVVGRVVNKISQTVYFVKILSTETVHKVHVNQLKEYYIHKPIYSPKSVNNQTPQKAPLSPKPQSQSPRLTSPTTSPVSTQPPVPNPVTGRSPGSTSTDQPTSSRGRVIKPTKRFTFSEFD
jgi:hypothetical protein